MITLFQYFGMSCVLLILKIFAKVEIVNRHNLAELKQPLIVVANHESHLDPPLVGIALMKTPRLFPIKFMAKNELFLIPVFNVIIWLLGSFKANRGKGLDRALETPFRILKKNGTVIMFPEGRIIWERGQLGHGKKGAAALAIMTRAAILPLSIHSPERLSWSKFLFTRRSSKHIKVNIGQPFYLDNVEYPDISDPVTSKATQKIMREIRKLYSTYTYQ